MGPTSHSKLILIEDFDLISATTIQGCFYGISFALYCLCTRSLYLQLHKWRQTKFTLTYITLVFFCSTVLLALNIGLMQVAYVRHADFPGGPWAYESSHNLAPRQLNMIGSTVGLVLAVLTMAIQVSINVA